MRESFGRRGSRSSQGGQAGLAFCKSSEKNRRQLITMMCRVRAEPRMALFFEREEERGDEFQLVTRRQACEILSGGVAMLIRGEVAWRYS